MHSRYSPPSLLRFVGRVARIGFRSALAYRAEFFIWILTTNMPLIMLLLWSSVARYAPVGSYGSKEFASYFLAVLFVRVLSGSWVVWQIHEEMQTARLNLRLLHPIHPFVAYLAEHLGYVPLRAIFLTPILCLFLYFYAGGDRTPLALLAFLPLILLQAWMIQFFVMSCMGAISLFWERALGLFDLWLTSYFALSGYLVPLDLFPSGLRKVVGFLPFRYLLSFPVELLHRRLAPEEFALHLGIQTLYLLAFMGLAFTLWEVARKKYMALGA